LFDEGEPRSLWLEEEDSAGGGWRRMEMAAATETRVHMCLTQ
nr:hypothetical protein [Tanacetum cinerariifolium]